MSSPVILDLCSGTGAWSQPYRNAGYDVRRVDPYTNGLLDQRPDDSGDVRLFRFPDYRVHGILAAPPCTCFSVARTRPVPVEEDFVKGLAVVDACIRIITVCRPDWWALENPKGRLLWWLGPPSLIFDPCDYGDPYTKRTCVWGNFKNPQVLPVPPITDCIGHFGLQGGIVARARRRAITPPGFARGFFEANP